MKRPALACLIAAAAGAGSPVLAQQAATSIADIHMQLAIDSGVCGDAVVASVVHDAAANTLRVTCEEDVQGFVPVLGGFALPVAAGIASVLAATAGGGGPADTISR